MPGFLLIAQHVYSSAVLLSFFHPQTIGSLTPLFTYNRAYGNKA